MAADTVEALAPVLDRRLRPSPTKHLPLRGAVGYDSMLLSDAASRLGVSRSLLEHLAHRYGTEARTVIAMMHADPELEKPLVPGLPHVGAEAVYAARYEMAQTLDDVLERRTRALLFARDLTAEHARNVAALLATELGWSQSRIDREVSSFLALVARERAAAGLGDHQCDPVATAP
jgi:glycerol-3-phosphate dehydrogenase